ncbi:unnamed protein product [Brassica oleracea]|uniref:Uncharacterized protein n=1 Tax=Brassica oleracea TaxID=3712 RepID=A0A3P6F7C6_BRAOL|nr:unnamed protein product [Brassica oleracea]
MRKALSRDVDKKSVIPLKRPITPPDELEYDLSLSVSKMTMSLCFRHVFVFTLRKQIPHTKI